MPEKILDRFVKAFANAMKLVDAEKPIAKKNFSPGIGPHEEVKTVALVLSEIKSCGLMGEAFDYKPEVHYPDGSKKCDLRLLHDDTRLYVEVKMMRKLRNNGDPEDYATAHILSPYSADRSALTDIDKLRNSGLHGPKAILIYGYDYDEFPLETVIDAFEQLADSKLGNRVSASFAGLVHPFHTRGVVHGWLVRE